MTATGIAVHATSRTAATLRAGLIGGVVGAVTSWIYELIVWVRLLHLTSAYGIAENTAVLSFGPGVRALGVTAFVIGVCIHFLTAVIWGIVFAMIWPALRARSIEATLAALFYGIFAWVFMHNVVLALFSPAPPTYTVYSVLNGLMAHTFAFSVPMALVIQRLLRLPSPTPAVRALKNSLGV
ncbi:MAG TPA: hypothetical protein VGM97_01360 [Steroidobacteraceae bacterium]|jgi:uncharacterized membrane protein YagU involved in acid resistance